MNRSRLASLVAAGAVALGTLATATVQASIAQAEPNNNEAGVCLHQGMYYSEGAKITLPDGTVLTCQHDGTWKRVAQPNPGPWLPPRGPIPTVQAPAGLLG
jgi:hypothetical protein